MTRSADRIESLLRSIGMYEPADGIRKTCNEAADLLADYKQRNRELTRQVEQLQANCVRLIAAWRGLAGMGQPPIGTYSHALLQCAKHLEIAITAPPSSAPTDPGRADTGMEET